MTVASASALSGSSMLNCLHIISLDLAVTWEGFFLYDSIVFCLTLFKTYKTRYRFTVAQTSVPILTLMLRDGKFLR